jgi:hypothetical protein
LIESNTTRRFWKAFAELPAEVQQSARDACRLFRDDPTYPGLHFKKLEDQDDIYSVRIGLAIAP